MTRSRKTLKKITKRALRKCRRMYRNGLAVHCTPVEYVALCWHFRIEAVPDYEYCLSKVTQGVSGCGWRYFPVPGRIATKYPPCEFAMLSVDIGILGELRKAR